VGVYFDSSALIDEVVVSDDHLIDAGRSNGLATAMPGR
jgi:hypothetical protein